MFVEQVTYLTTTSDVKELESPYGFTFAPTAFAFNKASKKMMEFFNWKRAAGLYDFLETGGLYVKVRLLTFLINTVN